MPNKRSDEKDVRKITKVGRQSLAITLPIEIVRDLKWRVGQKVTVKRIRGGVEVKDWRG